MTVDELAKLLRDRVKSAAEKRKATSIHLFGIEYADDLVGHNVKDICVLADIPVSYATEIYKGIRLAEFVNLKR